VSAENIRLGKRIEELSLEVTSSRAYIDKLLKTSHETNKSNWERKEEEYVTVVRNLRQQIRKQTSSVSIELYKAAVDTGKMKQVQLDEAKRKISTLERSVQKLEIKEAVPNLNTVTDPVDTQQTIAGHKGLQKNGLSKTGARGSRPKKLVSLSPIITNEERIYKNEGGQHDAPQSSKKITTPRSLCARKITPAVTFTDEKERNENNRVRKVPLSAFRNSSPREEKNGSPQKTAGSSMAQRVSGSAKANGIIGMTIAFETPARIKTKKNHGRESPISPMAMSPSEDVLTWADRYSSVNGTKENVDTERCSNEVSHKAVVSPRRQALRSHVLSSLGSPTSAFSRLNKENEPSATKTPGKSGFTNPLTSPLSSRRINRKLGCTTKVSPMSTSKTPSRLGAIQKYGGRRGLQETLRKMRSPLQ